MGEIDESWWNTRTTSCIELGYGGAMCSQECCGVPHGDSQEEYPLNARRAVISNADVSKKSLYLYGTGSFDGNMAYHNTCDHKCWSNWAGTDYNVLNNNCNTFTSTVLAMVYGLSQKKPNLGPSDMVTVHGHCPATGSEMPVASLYPELVTSRPVQVTGDSSGTQYVFLQKFPLGGGPIELFFHT